ncbi:MAG: YceI family protein [Gordonia sp. (in: high G+C Gram-positive bacteria)]
MTSTRTLTSDDGDLLLHTGVGGRAARTGHRLTIAMRDWTATATIDDDALTALEVSVRVDSLDVVSGEGGLTPMTGAERAVARSNALKSLKADKFGTVTYSSSSITADGDGYRIDGTLTICGVAKPHPLTVTAVGDTLMLDTPVTQTDFGVKPYSLMMGTLKVADEVRVTASVRR